MPVDYRIKEVFRKTGFTLTGFAKEQGKCFQSLSRKINHGKFNVDELIELAHITGCEFQCSFVFPDGVRFYLSDKIMKGKQNMQTDYNAMLYEKMMSEQDRYRDWLLSQSPFEILNHTYEYTMREDIVMAMEDMELSTKQAKALLKSPCPLEDILKDFRNRETDHMENIRDTVECRANAVVREDFKKAQRESR